jgi:uncharacterized repeat protein (TIGR02543 family)
MRKLSPILLLTTLVIIFSSCSKPDSTPPAPTNYTVTFNLNGGSGTLANQTVASGTAITLPNSSASTFFFTGYTFAGWNTAANGSGTSYAAGSSYTVSGNVTLYAIWQNATSYTVTYNLNGGTGVANPATVLAGASTVLPSSSASTFYFTNYNFVGWNTLANGSGTSYLAGASYTPTGNVTLYAIWQPMYTAVFTATDASGSALLKAIPNNSVVKAFVVNVTTAGTAKLETIGTMTNGNNAIAYYWITSRDSAEVFQATSTLNPILAKTSALSSQTINLPLGVNVICFKTAAYSGGITNGSSIGLKLTGVSTTVSNANYTADGTTPNQAGSVKINFFLNNGIVISPNIQNIGGVYAYFRVIPCSDQNATTYDGSLYPSISSISFDTRNTSWFVGPTTGYSGLDFTNASGSAGRNFALAQDNLGSISWIFINSQFGYNSGILQGSSATGVKLVKSFLGNYAYCSTFANVYNPSSTTFGSTNVCWYLKSINFVGNPELLIYDPSGNRIW